MKNTVYVVSYAKFYKGIKESNTEWREFRDSYNKYGEDVTVFEKFDIANRLVHEDIKQLYGDCQNFDVVKDEWNRFNIVHPGFTHIKYTYGDMDYKVYYSCVKLHII